ncbi:hypothetical protein E4U19_000991 [Claviceps sp. Clav32 group G5]|nr:hypothetical protein E4U19_000991 [Claviceps sp. Clav32 group G5]
MNHSDLEFANEKLKRVETEQNGKAQARDEATGSVDENESAQTPADANANGAPLEKLGTYDKYEITTTAVTMTWATASPTGRSDGSYDGMRRCDDCEQPQPPTPITNVLYECIKGQQMRALYREHLGKGPM